MSDFLTRLVERQADRIATIQPRIPSMFVSAVDRQDVPTPEPSLMSAPHPTGEGKPEREVDRLQTTPAEGERVTARSTAPTASSFFRAGAPDPDRPSVRPRLDEPTEQSSAMEGLNTPMPRSSHRQPVGTAAGAVQPQSGASEPTPMSVAVQRGRLNHADPPSGENIELPPRLVESRIETRVKRVAAPPSLVSTRFSGRRSEPIPQGEPDPPVQVTIGRIEVTAVTASPVPKRKSAPRQPSMSLQDYLSRRQGRGT
jgi:hypothetical protein